LITRYGKNNVMSIFIICTIILITTYFLEVEVIRIINTIIVSLIILFTLYFFRDPIRFTDDTLNSNIIISPADGKIINIEKFKNEKYEIFPIKSELVNISIFMSPFNVHVNRIPISGKIFSLNYIKGKYLVAFDEKSSENNERTEIGIKTEDGKSMLFKQIAGFVARRIVCELAINNDVRRGEKFGMIKFGSRVDIIIDSGSEILIEKGQKVKAGITNIAKIK